MMLKNVLTSRNNSILRESAFWRDEIHDKNARMLFGCFLSSMMAGESRPCNPANTSLQIHQPQVVVNALYVKITTRRHRDTFGTCRSSPRSSHSKSLGIRMSYVDYVSHHQVFPCSQPNHVQSVASPNVVVRRTCNG